MCTEEVTNQDPQSKRRSRPKEKKKAVGKRKRKKGVHNAIQTRYRNSLQQKEEWLCARTLLHELFRESI